MKKRNIFLIIILILIILGLSIGLTFLLRKDDNTAEKLEIDSPTTWRIEQSMETIGNVSRNIPSEYNNEGLCEKYPTYSGSLDLEGDEITSLFAEDKLLRVGSDTYDSMDKNGNLYLNGVATGRKLYKHTASENMYLGNVDDSEQAVIEKITVCPTEDRNYITGIFAPAGEVIKIEISEEDLESVGELMVTVGQCTHRNILNSIPNTKTTYVRMPNMANFFTIKNTTTYVGNYLGGPIYLKTKNLNVQYSVTISGGVKYPIYIHGYTTKEDLEESKNYSAPYFDFELQSLGVRHSGPKGNVDMSFSNLYNCGELWKNICLTSRSVPNTSNKYVSVGFLYDPYVARGSACAWQGGNIWVSAPCSWITGGLNYQSMTTDGFWGIIHEFNHHFQNYGIEPYLEVTNNAASLLSYVSYTNISAYRTENDGSLSWWNRYTNPLFSLKQTISTGKTGQTALNIYADIIHSFGVEKFVEATQYNAGNHTVEGWYEAVCKATNYDMSYYFEELLGHTISDSVKAKYLGEDYPIFVPVACLYQTGRNYYYLGEENWANTVKPYTITKGEDLTLNFEDYLVLPSDFEYEIVNMPNPIYGSLTRISDKKYTYSANNHTDIDKFMVEIKLKHSTITTPNIKFEIQIDFKDQLPTRTKYTFDTNKYSTCDDALNNNFEGYTNKDITYAKSTFMNGIGNKQIGVVEGKIYIEESDEYTICLRAGRGKHALYISYDGKVFEKAIAFDGTKNTFENGNGHTINLDLKGGTYLWYKQVTISDGSADAYTELGWNVDDGVPYTIPARNLYNVSSEHEEYTFASQSIFTKEYVSDEIVYTSDNSISSIVSGKQEPWDDSTGIANILDGDSSTFFHTKRYSFVSIDNPCEIVVDLGEANVYNNLNIINRTTNVIHMPITFKLYGGENLDNMTLLKDCQNEAYSGNTLSVTFDKTKIRYYKLIIYDTKDNNRGDGYDKYVSIAELEMRYIIPNIQEYSCDLLEYYDFSVNNHVFSSYGHTIYGAGYITYSFDGSDFVLYTRNNQDCTIRVTIDGKQKDIKISASTDKLLTPISSGLSDSKHTLKIEVLSGQLHVDSFGISQG